MSETFDYKLPRITGELLTTPECIKILADEILKKKGKEFFGHPFEVHTAEWNDPQTGARLRLERHHDDEETCYFLEQYNAHKSKSDAKAEATFYMDSTDYKVYLLDRQGHYIERSEEDPDPADDLLNFMTHAPGVRKRADRLLEEHEDIEIANRCEHMVGRRALEESDVLRRMVYGAHSRKTPERIEQGLQKIAETMTVYEISARMAYRSIQSFYEDHLAKRNKRATSDG